MPEKSAASVDAVSGGASITRPPCAVRCTVRPEKSFCTSCAKAGRSGSVGTGAGASRDSSAAVTMASISRSLESSSASRAAPPGRQGRLGDRRDDSLDPREEGPGALERHLVGRAVEEPGEERPLVAHEVGDPRLDAGLADQVVDVDRAALAEPVDPADPLLEDRRVPGQLEVDAGARRALQVEPHAARVRREEDAARGIVVELHEVLRPALLAFLAGEERRPDARPARARRAWPSAPAGASAATG